MELFWPTSLLGPKYSGPVWRHRRYRCKKFQFGRSTTALSFVVVPFIEAPRLPGRGPDEYVSKRWIYGWWTPVDMGTLSKQETGVGAAAVTAKPSTAKGAAAANRRAEYHGEKGRCSEWCTVNKNMSHLQRMRWCRRSNNSSGAATTAVGQHQKWILQLFSALEELQEEEHAEWRIRQEQESDRWSKRNKRSRLAGWRAGAWRAGAWVWELGRSMRFQQQEQFPDEFSHLCLQGGLCVTNYSRMCQTPVHHCGLEESACAWDGTGLRLRILLLCRMSYPMFIEPTIIRVPSGFSGYICNQRYISHVQPENPKGTRMIVSHMLNTKNVLKTGVK